MQLTLHADYALRVLMYLGIHEERLCSVAEIAAAYRISKNHLVKVVHHLAKSGFIETVRGRQGGLRLAHRPASIRVGAVYRATEPTFALAECFEDKGACRIGDACVLRRALDEALQRFCDTLDRYTLADLLARPQPVAELLRIEPGRKGRERSRDERPRSKPRQAAARRRSRQSA